MTVNQWTTFTTRTPATSAAIYGAMADRMERDPIGPDGSGRATVCNGRGFKLWQRFNQGAELVWVESIDGRMVALTPKQAQVFDLAKALMYDPQTMREMAKRLNVAPSTVSRALVKLAAWGLIAYVAMRGRYAAVVIVMRQVGDGRERFRQAAKAKVRQWSQAAERRISRLWANVAPYISEEGSRGSGSVYRDTYLVSTMDATLKAPWTPEDLRDAGII